MALLAVSAATGVGLKEWLDLCTELAPAPDQIERTAVDAEGNAVTLEQTADAPLAAQVFKVRVDPFVQKLSYVRIFSGSLEKDQSVHVSGVRRDVKLNPLLMVQGEATEPIDSAIAGQIVAIAKMDDLHIGTSLGEVSLPKIEFPEPMVGRTS